MGVDKKYIKKVTEENIDDWLHSTGFLFPQTKKQMERFDKLYEDYDFKLKDKVIDVESIIKGTFCFERETTVLHINSVTTLEIESLKMAARNGQNNISQKVIDKMKENQKKRKK
ncbi:hypothetical protein [uncultured Chryseobacterium sp.]|uniref:hypothetical protein n=1 Tax=uncultured Chryseobacterium sp. TaxID=259322 RepID=UPI003749ACFE